MIHRELFDPAFTKNYSSLQMQFYIKLSRYVCLDGHVPLNYSEMAYLLSCELQTVYQLVKKGVREGILKWVHGQLHLVKKVVNDEYVFGYVKHFPFLESKEFFSLSLHAQRFVLYALWYGVYSGRHLKMKISSLYHSNNQRKGILNLYTKKPLYQVIDEVKGFLKCEILEEEDKVYVTGIQPEYDHKPLENEGELKWLNDFLEKEEASHFLSHDSKIEIISLKKHYTSKTDSIGIGLFVNALKKLLSSHKIMQLDERKEIGPYFKKIMDQLFAPVLSALEKQVSQVKELAKEVKEVTYSWINMAEGHLNKLAKSLNQSFSELLAPIKKDEEKVIAREAIAVAQEQKVDPIKDLLSSHGIHVEQSTLEKWRKLAREEEIIHQIKSILGRKDIKNLIGYITKILGSSHNLASFKTDLPWYVIKQQKDAQASSKREVTIESIDSTQKQEALHLLLALGEISQEDYDQRMGQFK